MNVPVLPKRSLCTWSEQTSNNGEFGGAQAAAPMRSAKLGISGKAEPVVCDPEAEASGDDGIGERASGHGCVESPGGMKGCVGHRLAGIKSKMSGIASG